MEQSEVQAQRESAIQSQGPIDIVTKESREKAKRVAPEDLQREILAQLYLQNHHISIQTNKLKNIDTQTFVCAFILVLSVLGSLFVYIFSH